MNSFYFEDKDPIFTRLKPGLALKLLSNGLFYKRAMEPILINCLYMVKKNISLGWIMMI